MYYGLRGSLTQDPLWVWVIASALLWGAVGAGGVCLLAGGPITGSTGTFTSTVTAPLFSGNLAGNVNGNLTGKVTGNATTATALAATPNATRGSVGGTCSSVPLTPTLGEWGLSCGANGTLQYTANGHQPVDIGSGFSQDVSKWGVKADGKMAGNGCRGTAGSNAVGCWDNPPSVVQNFTAADVGKLIIMYEAGPPSGQVVGTMSVVSGGTGGTPGWQPITFTDTTDGCSTNSSGQPNYTTMVYAYANVGANGVPTGNLTFTRGFHGEGCTHPPTQGTVATVTGTVTFTGGTMQAGDWPTVITGVTDAHNITVADPPPVNFHTQVVYGTDDHDAWEAASAANYIGWMTLSGTSLVSHGIDCSNARFQLTGTGWGYVGPSSAQLIYAGKNTGDHILQIHSGWGVKLERLSFKGNSMARPIAILASINRPPLTGNGLNQMNMFDQVWAGWQWGDNPQTYENRYQLQSCFFADAAALGNVDFATFDRFYCFGSEVGFDANNQQAGDYIFRRLMAQSNNIGTAIFGGQTYDDYYTEGNRLDIMMGSPTNPGGIGVFATFKSYGGESSTQAFAYTAQEPNSRSGTIEMNAGNLGLPQMSGNNTDMNPTGIWVDFAPGSGTLTYRGPIYNQGKLTLSNGCWGGASEVNLEGVRPNQISWSTFATLTCKDLLGSWLHMKYQGNAIYFNTDTMLPNTNMLTAYLQTDNFFQNTIGSINVRSPIAPGNPTNNYISIENIGTQGTTTYNYQVTCLDGQGLETAHGRILTTTTGAALLNITNYNIIFFSPSRGCASYSLYGNEGSGPIAYLTTMRQDQLGFKAPGATFPDIYFADQGQWTKNTSRVPPAITQSGIIDAEHGYKVNGQLLASRHLADFDSTPPADGQVPRFNATTGKYAPSGIPGPWGGIQMINGSSNANQQIVAGTGIDVSSSNGTTTITNTGGSSRGGGNSAEVCHNYAPGTPGNGNNVDLINCTGSLVAGGHYRVVGWVRTVMTTSSGAILNFAVAQGTNTLCGPSNFDIAPSTSQTFDGAIDCEFTVTSSTTAVAFGGSLTLTGGSSQKPIGMPGNNSATITLSPSTFAIVGTTKGANTTVTGQNLVVYRVY